MKKLIVLASVVALTACSSTGVKVDPARIDSFIPGTTTYSQVANDIGPPTGLTKTASGTTAMWIYSSARARPESFIPVVGAFVGGADVESSSAVLTFDTSGVLRAKSYSSGGTGTGYGAESLHQDRQPQPREE